MTALLLGTLALSGSVPGRAQDEPTITIPGVQQKIPRDVKELDFFGTQVTDVGLKYLAFLKNLKSLKLSGTKVSDAGMKELAALKNLTKLNLSFTQVSDAGLKELAALESLDMLDLA